MLFKRKPTRQHTGANSTAPDNNNNSAEHPSDVTDQLALDLGEVEKHRVEINFDFPMAFKVDGEDVSRRFRCGSQSGVEICEGIVGVQETSELRIERASGILFASKIRVFVNGRLHRVLKGRPRRPTKRTITFRLVLPFIFLLLVTYYAVILQPDVLNFYCGSTKAPAPQLKKPNGKRVAPGRDEQKQLVRIDHDFFATSSVPGAAC